MYATEFNYCGLPNEVKSHVIGQMERDDRITIQRVSRRENILAQLQENRCATFAYFDREFENYRISLCEKPAEDGYYYDNGEQLTKGEFKWMFDIMDSFDFLVCQNLVAKDLFPEDIDNIRYFTKIKAVVFSSDIAFDDVKFILKKSMPKYLEKIVIHGRYTEEEWAQLYRLPQVLQAEHHEFSHSTFLTNQHLLDFNGHTIMTSSRETSVTAAGVNQFIKNRMPTINEKYLKFKFSENVIAGDGLFAFFQDFNTSEFTRRVVHDDGDGDEEIEVTFLINTPYPEYKLRITIADSLIEGERILSE